MNEPTIQSALLQKAVTEVSRLPGIGRKTALRLVLHLVREPEQQTEALAHSLLDLRHGLHYCRMCHNLCDTDCCEICASPRRDHHVICVVEDLQDVMAIENTHQYDGVYHVLGGVISPMDGIGPENLEINSLTERVLHEDIREVILALSPTMEGDTTNFFIYRRLQDTGVKITVIARGVAQNDELQYTDEITLGRALVARTPFTWE